MKKSPWKRYAIAAGFGAGVFLLLMAARGGFTASEPAELWQVVSDSLFVPGVLMAAFGLLLFAADGGVFDMLKFGLMKAFGFLMSKKKREAVPATFYDYKEMRDAKPRAKVAHLLIVGGVMIALAAIALVMYGQYEPIA